MRREIKPRKLTMRGVEQIYVNVPKDLHNPNESKKRFFRNDKNAALAFVRELQRRRTTLGSEFHKLPILTQANLLNALANTQPEDIVTAIDYWKASQPKNKKTIRSIMQQCLDEKKSALRSKSLSTLKSSLGKFTTFMESDRSRSSIDEVTTEDCKLFIYGGEDSNGKKHFNKWSPKTRLNYMKDGMTLFKFAIAHQYVVRDPFVAVTMPKVDQKWRKIFHVSEAKILLDTIHENDPALLGIVCPDLFGGLRPHECRRTKKENVKKDKIELGGDATKKRDCRSIEINETLRAWLSVEGVEFGGADISKRMKKIREIAGKKLSKELGKTVEFPWGHDILRHTFISNSVHVHGVIKSADLACTSESLVKTTYFTRIGDMEEVNAFWALRPDPNIKPPIIYTITREELYKKIWEKPIVQVAKEFGISNVALAKRCVKMNVPRPPLGYWAKVEAGQKPEVTPLPRS